LSGAADSSDATPKLAGVPAYYLAKQLRDFASGVRADDVMSPIARAMKPEDKADVSEYYSGVRGTPTASPATEPDLLALGTRLATVGDENKMVQACESCHGLEGRGEGPAIPPLAGQYASYIALQMRMWQEGQRKNDASQQMTNIAKRLSAQDIQAIGLYFERIPQTDFAKNSRQLPADGGRRVPLCRARHKAPPSEIGRIPGKRSNAQRVKRNTHWSG
jgi:cytochrome c553